VKIKLGVFCNILVDLWFTDWFLARFLYSERGLTNALVNVDIGVISLLVVDGVDPNLVIFLHIHNTLNS